MRLFLRILSYARPIGWYIPQYLLLIVLATIFSVVNFAVMIPLLRVLFETSETQLIRELPDFSFTISYFKNLFYFQLTQLIEVKGKIYALYFICGVALGSVFLSNLFRYLSQLIIAKVRVNVIRNLRNSLFQHIAKLELNYFTEHNKGDIMSRVTGDVAEVETSIVSSLKVFIREPFLIAGYFTALFTMSFELTLYTLILIPVSGTVISILTKRLKRSATKSQQALGKINSSLDESLSGMRIVKAFGAVNYMIRKFQKSIDQFARYNFKMAARSNLAAPVSELLGVSVLTLILLIGGTMVLNDSSSLDAAEFIGFLLIFAQVLNPAKALSAAFGTVNRGIAAGERVFELMDTQPVIKDKEDAKTIKSFENEIRFENVSFSYDQKRVLNNINLEIKKGSAVALVGPSGGGKSTLTDLILRFYDPSEGEILLDGQSLKDLRSASVLDLIGVVSQETILFNDTVANNIAFGKQNASREEIEKAAQIANAHTFIVELENSYETNIGERGNKLSGGQRQRISIARAVLKNPPILILDEATSSLDSESELVVQQAISNLMKNRTAIIIAHRLSTIQHADKIVVLDNGEIAQEGTHETLARTSGLYRKFSEMQSF